MEKCDFKAIKSMAFEIARLDIPAEIIEKYESIEELQKSNFIL
nr:MAG TPA: hypothetical protein [Caudoviricetes sp.]